MKDVGEQLSLFDPDTWSGRTCLAPSVQTVEKTSGQSSKKRQKSQMKQPLFLDLRGSGATAEPSWVTGGALLGEYTMHSFGESPSVAVESRLSAILEGCPHPKYSLSANAVIGILRRANRRGKELPKQLEQALYEQSGIRSDTYGQTEIADAGQVLRTLWEEIGEASFIKWAKRTAILVQQKKILLCGLCEQNIWRKPAEFTCKYAKSEQTKSEECYSVCPVRYLWESGIYGGSSQRQKPNEQFIGKLSALVQELSRQTAPYTVFVCCLRQACQGSQSMQQALASVENEYQTWMGYRIYSKNKGENEQDGLTEQSGAQREEAAGGTGKGTESASRTAIPINTMVATKTAQETRTTFGVGEDGDAQFTISSSHSHAVCAGFSFGQSEKARSIGYQEEISPTLRGGEGGNQKPCVYDARGNGDGKTICTLTGDHQNRVTDYTALCIGNGQVNQSVDTVVGALNTMHDQQAVMVSSVDCRNLNEHQEVSGTLQCKQDGGYSLNYQNPIRVQGEVAHTLKAKANCDFLADSETYPVQNSVVRRLTPLEAERLQGYPDGYTDIGEWVDSKGKRHKPADSPRYKALGNSIALPFWFWLLRRISAQYYRPATLGSLFDGIGGFPLCWERCNERGTALWASEIEEFPIAVTKKRFGD